MSISSGFCKFTSDSSPSPRLAFIELFVCACVFTIMLFTENLWQADGERVHHRLPRRYTLRTQLSSLCVWPFFAGSSLVLLVLLVTVTYSLFRRLSSRLHAMQIYCSSFVRSIGIIPSVFYYEEKNKSPRSLLERNQRNEI